MSPVKPEKTKTIDPFGGGLYIKSSTPVKVKYEEKGARKVKVIFDKDESSRDGFDKNSITDVMDRDYQTETDIDGMSVATLPKQNGYGIIDPTMKRQMKPTTGHSNTTRMTQKTGATAKTRMNQVAVVPYISKKRVSQPG
tara:strand:- start:1533 stop:1952 length:420 start_codon:yes stop_codon:yes gene_type:complete